ncbi:MAG: DUF2335 domain-containing protein [Candidatus Contendobacter sp.]
MTADPSPTPADMEPPALPVSQKPETLAPAEIQAIIRQEIRGALVARRETFAGPMPPPEYLKQYDQVVPGAAKDIVTEFLANGAHERDLDRLVLKSVTNQNARSQWMAFGLVLIGFVLIMGLAFTGHDAVAGIVAGALLGAVITGFLTGNLDTPKPRDKSSPSQFPPDTTIP